MPSNPSCPARHDAWRVIVLSFIFLTMLWLCTAFAINIKADTTAPPSNASSSPAPATRGLHPVPGPDDIFKNLRPEHPRLLATREDFLQLKKRIDQGNDPYLTQWHQQLLKQAQALEEQQPVAVRVVQEGSRVVFQGIGQFHHRAYLLSLLYQLHGDMKYVDLLWRDIQVLVEAPDWSPRHFLGAAEASRSLAIAYDWMYDALTPQQRQAIEKAIIDRAMTYALAAYEGRYIHGWWPAVTTNWNQVCNGGMGMAAIAIAEADPRLTSQILTHTLRLLPISMTSYAPDGAWPEGIAYWGYGGSYNVQFIASLQSAFNTDFGLSSMQGYDRTGLYPILLTGPTGLAFNYGDSPYGARSASPDMLWYARQFNNPRYAAHYLPKTAGKPLDLIWYNEEIAAAAQAMIQSPSAMNLPLDHRFRSSDIFTFRSNWDDPAATFLAFKAGDNKFNHSQLDLGSFVLEAQGQRFIIDLGSDSYALPEYFHARRWTYFRNRTEAHNTLLINHDGSPGQDPKAAARVLSFDVTENGASATFDLTAAYAKIAHPPQRVTRTFIRQDKTITIIDRITADADDTSIHWLLYTPAKVEITQHDAVLTLKNARLLVRLCSPQHDDATWLIEPAQPLPGSPNPQGQNPNRNLHRLYLKLPPGQWQNPIAVQFIPLEENQNPTDIPTASPCF